MAQGFVTVEFATAGSVGLAVGVLFATGAFAAGVVAAGALAATSVPALSPPLRNMKTPATISPNTTNPTPPAMTQPGTPPERFLLFFDLERGRLSKFSSRSSSNSSFNGREGFADRINSFSWETGAPALRARVVLRELAVFLQFQFDAAIRTLNDLITHENTRMEKCDEGGIIIQRSLADQLSFCLNVCPKSRSSQSVIEFPA